MKVDVPQFSHIQVSKHGEQLHNHFVVGGDGLVGDGEIVSEVDGRVYIVVGRAWDIEDPLPVLIPNTLEGRFTFPALLFKIRHLWRIQPRLWFGTGVDSITCRIGPGRQTFHIDLTAFSITVSGVIHVAFPLDFIKVTSTRPIRTTRPMIMTGVHKRDIGKRTVLGWSAAHYSGLY
jgi:hypothetical protein